MLETGRYVTIREIAKAEKINSSCVSRVLRLTLLARHCRSYREWETYPEATLVTLSTK